MRQAGSAFRAPEDMTPAQRNVYDAIVSGPRGTLVGPLRAALHNPALADRWQKLGQVLRFETSIPTALNELAILVTARRWNSELEWAIHARDAARAGLDSRITEAIRTCDLPDLARTMPRVRSMNCAPDPRDGRCCLCRLQRHCHQMGES